MPINRTPIADADAPNALRPGDFIEFLSTDGRMKLKSFTGVVTELYGAVAATLSALTLSASTIAEGSAAATVVGALVGRTAGSTLSLVDTAGNRFALSGTNIVAGSVATDFSAATSHNITVRETLAGATNTPRDTVLSITVTDVVTLSALTLMGNSVEEGTAPAELVGVLAGRTTGSTLSLTDTAGDRFALSGLNIVTGATATNFGTAASHSITVREVLSGATNTPRDTVLTINVTEAPPSEIEPLTAAQASRFLNSATIGATESEMTALTGADQADMDAWFAAQAAEPASITGIITQSGVGSSGPDWIQLAVTGADQLRQRMTLALSEILVVSTVGTFAEGPRPVYAYGDVLSNGALGRYRTLLGNVSRHTAMGVFLTHFRNDKADAVSGRRPDENYAREVMQLFTIGLNELNIDGTLVLDGGQPVPTYGQNEIIGTAAVFTGLGPNFDGSRGPGTTSGQRIDYWLNDSAPDNRGMRLMSSYPEYHEITASKNIVGGVTIPGGGTVDSDVDAVLDALCEHPSCAPFICKQLIQRLTTSNPTPSYVQRVATRWLETYDDADHLLQVAKAILLDQEALNPPSGSSSSFGRAQSPLYQTLRLLRAFGAASIDTGEWNLFQIGAQLGQMRAGFLGAPSVFNFYRPDFEIPTQPGLLVPELQIVSEASLAQTSELLFETLYRFRAGNGTRYTSQSFDPVSAGADLDGIYVNFGPWEARAATPTALVDALALLLTGDRMPAADRTIIANAVAATGNGGAPAPIATQKVLTAAVLFGIAPTSTVN